MRWMAHPMAKPAGFLLCLLPAFWLIWAAVFGELGPNPAEALIRSLGDWTLRFLVIALTVTPLRVTFHWPWLARWRRMLGLFVFFYATLHWLSYVWFDMGLDVYAVLADIPQRPFILVGTLAWLLLLALACTSFNQAVRWLGAPRWRSLHKTVYAIAMLGVLHFFWMRAGKNDFAEVAVYALLMAALLGWRLQRFLRMTRA